MAGSAKSDGKVDPTQLISQFADLLLVLSIVVQLMVIKVNQSTSGWSRTSAFMRAIAVMLRYQSVLGQYELLVEKIPALFSKITGLAEGIQLIIGTHDVYVFFLKVFVIAGCLAIVYQFVVGVKACEDQESTDANFFANFVLAIGLTVGLYWHAGSKLDASLFTPLFFVSASHLIEAVATWTQLVYNAGGNTNFLSFGHVLSITLAALSKFISLILFRAEYKGNIDKILHALTAKPSVFSMRLAALIIVLCGLAYILLSLSKGAFVTPAVVAALWSGVFYLVTVHIPALKSVELLLYSQFLGVAHGGALFVALLSGSFTLMMFVFLVMNGIQLVKTANLTAYFTATK